MTAPLLSQILKMLFFVLVGFAMRKTGVITNEQSKGFAIVSIYAVIPCAVLLSFQKDIAPGITGSLLKCEAAIIVIHLILFAIYALLCKVFKFTPSEGVSMIYPNTGNMIIPIVMAILGNDYLIYTAIYMSTQNILLWSHGYSVVSGEPGINIVKIVKNPAMIASAVGLVMFVFQIKMPAGVYDLCNLAGNMTAPLAMLTAGVLLGELNKGEIKSYRRLPLMVATKLVIIPVLFVAILKLLSMTTFNTLGPEVFAVLLLSIIAPPASTILQIAQVYTDDAKYISCINSVCMVCCAVTMPLIMALYEFVM